MQKDQQFGSTAMGIVLAAASMFMPASAMAQAGASPKVGGNNFEEIVVTARRTEEKIEKVPTAVTAFGAAQLQERGIRTQEDLQLTVPGFTIRQTENQNLLTFSIRGQTVDAFTGSATAVVSYINDVQTNALGASSFYDLSSIQVLKGPQGTLFGRNATGGAVVYTTAQPDTEFGGYLQAGYGNYDAFNEQGAINVPIIADKVLLRVAFNADDQNGYIHDLYHNTDLGKTDRQSVRGSLTVMPTDDLKNTTVFEYDHSLGNNTGDIAAYVVPGGPAATVYSPALGAAAWATYLAGNPHVPFGGATAYQALQNQRGPYTVDNIEGSFHKEHGYYITNHTTYDVSPDLQIKNIFGYTYDNDNQLTSEEGTPYGEQYTENLVTGDRGNRVNTSGVSEELQANGTALDDSLKYIGGVYYVRDKTDILYPQSYFNLAPLFPPTGVTSHYNSTDSTEAIYAQGTYDLQKLTGIEGLSVTGGYRYAWETFQLAQLEGSDELLGPNGLPVRPQTLYFSNPSWLASVSYQVNDDLMVYVQGRRSWRSGGLNGVAPPIYQGAAGGGDEFSPEYTRDVEAGLKFAGDVFDRASHFNIAVYNQWIDNVQRAEFPNECIAGSCHSIAVTINVPSAEVSGLEFDTAIKATDWLEVGASGTYNYARYTGNTALIFGTLYVFGPYGDVPRVSGTLYGQVTLPVPEEIGRMTLRGDMYAQSSQWYSNNGNTLLPNTQLPGYALINLRADWANVFGTSFSMAGWVKNLTDRVYYVGGLAQGISLGSDAVSVGRPRMYGISFRYDF